MSLRLWRWLVFVGKDTGEKELFKEVLELSIGVLLEV
jgi:hypothetical protein